MQLILLISQNFSDLLLQQVENIVIIELVKTNLNKIYKTQRVFI